MDDVNTFAQSRTIAQSVHDGFSRPHHNGMTRLNVRFVADTDEKRSKGLMFASPLEPDEVALFVFPTTGRHAFWNKNVPFGLSLAFLDENHRVVDVQDMEAQSMSRCEPNDSNVKFVVEAATGTWDRLGVERGDILDYRDHKLVLTALSTRAG